MIFKFHRDFNVYTFLSTQSPFNMIKLFSTDDPIYQVTSNRVKVLKIIVTLGILITLAISITAVAYFIIGNRTEKGTLTKQ